MKKIEAVVRCSKLQAVKNALRTQHAIGMTITEVFGAGADPGCEMVYRGVGETIDLLRHIKLEVVASDADADRVVDLIFQNAHTGGVGDGRIFITDIDATIHIRTGEVEEIPAAPEVPIRRVLAPLAPLEPFTRGRMTTCKTR